MYRNVSMNLKGSGHFIAVTPPSTNDPREYIENALAARPTQYDNMIVIVVKDVEEGVSTHFTATIKTGKVEFDTYRLISTVYERSARKGELRGNLTWR